MRKHYLDHVRWATVVTVVIYHVFYMYNAEGVAGGLGKITNCSVQYYDVILYLVYPWIMPVLFIVSGICSRYYLDTHTSEEFIKSRTTKLLVPSTIGLFVFQFIQGYVNMSLGGAFESMPGVPGFVLYMIMAASGIGVLWYIQLLWVFSMGLILIRKIEKDRLWKKGENTNLLILILLVLVIFVMEQIGNTPVIVVYRFGLYGACFLFGYFIFSHDAVMEELKKNALLLAVTAIVLEAVFSVLYFGKNYADAPVNRTFLFAGCAWFSSLAILGLAAKYADGSNAFTEWMNRHSFGLYMFHYLGISSVALFLGKPGKVPASLVYVLSLAAGFLSGFLLFEVISRIPFFRWAVLGITGKNSRGKKHVS